MEKFLHPMFLFDALLPMGAGLLFCCWMLWDLRKENKAAEARKAALAALQAQTAAARAASPYTAQATPSVGSSPSSGAPASPPLRFATPALTPPSLPATLHMTLLTSTGEQSVLDLWPQVLRWQTGGQDAQLRLADEASAQAFRSEAARLLAP